MEYKRLSTASRSDSQRDRGQLTFQRYERCRRWTGRGLRACIIRGLRGRYSNLVFDGHDVQDFWGRLRRGGGWIGLVRVLCLFRNRLVWLLPNLFGRGVQAFLRSLFQSWLGSFEEMGQRVGVLGSARVFFLYVRR